jgi:hypothetical protein
MGKIKRTVQSHIIRYGIQEGRYGLRSSICSLFELAKGQGTISRLPRITSNKGAISRLPHELWNDILLFLRPFEYPKRHVLFDPHTAVQTVEWLDLIASALTCEEWYDEACRLIPKDCLLHLSIGNHISMQECVRMAKLLSQSVQYGMSKFIGMVGEISASDKISDVAYPKRLVHDVIWHIIRLKTSRLYRLALTRKGYDMPDTQEPKSQTDIKPLLHANTEYLHLDGVQPTRIISITCSTFAHNLSRLSLLNVVMCDYAIQALCQCISLKQLYLENVDEIDMLHNAVPHWKQLTSFSYNLAKESMDRLAVNLASSIHSLKIFRYKAACIGFQGTPINTLCRIIVMQQLEEFYICNSKDAHDGLLRTLMAYGGSLRRISIICCQFVKGINIRPFTIGFWPILHTISFAGCIFIDLGFLELIVQNCKNLKKIIPPEYFSNNVDVEQLMSKHGFHKNNNSFIR